MNRYRLIPASEAPPVVSLTGNGSLLPDNWLKLMELFLLRYRQRVNLILTHLKGKIEITEDNRVIYLEPNREEGSPLYDLIYFFVTPIPSKGSQMRPLDALRFGKLLHEAGVSLYAYGAGKKDFAQNVTTMHTINSENFAKREEMPIKIKSPVSKKKRLY